MLLKLGFVRAPIEAAFSNLGASDQLAFFNNVSSLLAVSFFVLTSLIAVTRIIVGRYQNIGDQGGFSSSIAMIVLNGSLLTIIFVGVFSSYPGGRVWLPYWPSVSVLVGVVGEYSFSRLSVGQLSASHIIIAAFLTLGLSSLSTNFTGNYITELRPFYFQYKSLMHYSRSQNLRCLSYGDFNDNVLRFYFMNPQGGIPEPEECPDGQQSQPGFMQYSHDNKEPFFE